MSNEATIQVELLGQQLSIGGEESGHLQEVAAYIQKKLQEVADATHNVGPTRTALLTAINIASDYIKLAKENRLLKENILKRSKNLQKILDDISR